MGSFFSKDQSSRGMHKVYNEEMEVFLMRSIQKAEKAVDTRREVDNYYFDLEMVRRENERFQSRIKEKLDWIRKDLLSRQFVIMDDFWMYDEACPYSDEEVKATAFIQFLHENRGRSL